LLPVGIVVSNALVSLVVALDIGSHFAIREGGKTVGSGVITEVVE
jgi:translation elongation factor EF-Tu-like GTPase